MDDVWFHRGNNEIAYDGGPRKAYHATSQFLGMVGHPTAPRWSEFASRMQTRCPAGVVRGPVCRYGGGGAYQALCTNHKRLIMLKVAPWFYGSLNVACAFVDACSGPAHKKLHQLASLPSTAPFSYRRLPWLCREMCSPAPTLHASAQACQIS
ncbi:hypothetical protein BDW02DRAFT_103516 [Decorospora gaudefroyi]|uniref:Uncharacterized protein n=1 Tax=Decorospora gaudefroyi TaxID=184978 RepID=A0A6A5K225_9PLEO|nr:hypothetical protein BDW02DRAFT_103516 [Decorospora gaudefroyi]